MKTMEDIKPAKFNVCDNVIVRFNKQIVKGVVQSVIHRGLAVSYDVSIKGAKRFKRYAEADVKALTNERYIVTCVDMGDSSDGLPRVLKVCLTEDDAKDYIEKDIRGYKGECVWNYSKVEV